MRALYIIELRTMDALLSCPIKEMLNITKFNNLLTSYLVTSVFAFICILKYMCRIHRVKWTFLNVSFFQCLFKSGFLLPQYLR